MKLTAQLFLLISGIFCCATAPMAWAAPAGLLDLYMLAQIEDPDFASANALYQSDLEYSKIGRAGLLPKVTASISSTKTRYSLEPNGSAKLTDYNYTTKLQTIQLSQVIFDWEKFSAYNENKKRAKLAEATFSEAKGSLIMRVAQAYFNYLLAMDNIDLAKAQSDALRMQSEQAENLYKAGVGAITDVEETKAQYQLAEVQQISANSNLEVKVRELAKLVGNVHEKIQQINGSIMLEMPQLGELAGWQKAAANAYPKAVIQRMNVLVAEAMVSRSNSGNYPTLILDASKQKGDAPNYFSNADNSTKIGLQFNFPLYEGGKFSALIKQSNLLRDKARFDLESAVREGQIAASLAYFGVFNGILQIRALEQAVLSSERTLGGMKVGQQVGFRTNTDVLNAQQRLFTSKRELRREIYNYMINRIKLKYAVGDLEEDELKLVDGMIRSAR
jgi:outer membrane protein